MTRILTIIALLFATPAWTAETVSLYGKEVKVRETLACKALSEISVRMDDFNISSNQYSQDNLKEFEPITVAMLADGDLAIGSDRLRRQTGQKESNEGFFMWGNLMQAELKQTKVGLLMFFNEGDSRQSDGKYRIWTNHKWYRCF
jgi:hypothetical protein